MKVAIVNQHPNDVIGGSEIQCDIIAAKLQEFGHEVVYVAINGCSSYNTSYEVKKSPSNPFSIARTIKSVNPDIVYWRYNKKNFYVSSVIIKKQGIPIVFSVSHINDTLKWRRKRNRLKNESLIRYFSSIFKKMIIARVNHFGYKYVDGVIVNNEHHLNKLNVSPQVYIPNSNSTKSVTYKHDKPFVTWVANLKTQKRPELCIDLAKLLSSTDVDILMVGNIQHEQYNYFNSEEFLPSNLKYLGPKTVKEVNGILKESICLIHTCKPEGFPGNFIQAWLQGKPVISYEFDPGGIIQSEGLGLVSNSDMNQFSIDVKKIIADKKLREDIGKRSVRYSNIHFNPVKNVKNVEIFLKNILNNDG